ncbi:MAG: hypothetical protein JOZ91_05620 [Candidatus Eremiobacteraeota bacterium]|nr:hypothetical protein [Candidatus Eremiobacteraeota bacterium]MBV8203546.1 hypothetical protein [Candidatus Eremiobacteraeota bacterium]MBV8263315.1 hypothetical protein [Candidatus Eremiobacteraeota bacterium]MBV8339393.1 hypothetical protein [Candidatus Eremiobacteraeota bacterium]MBV8667926.1 hypothetical protein [Candidatus Eremiobacteraeota bacterium]
MKYFVIGIIVVVGALIVWAAFGIGKAFMAGFSKGFVQAGQSNSTFHAAYRRGFKQNFLRSCERGQTDARTQSYCTCAEDGLEQHFDDAGLMALATSATAEQREVVQQIVRACYLKSHQP